MGEVPRLPTLLLKAAVDTKLGSQRDSYSASVWSFPQSVLVCTHLRVRESFWVRHVAIEAVVMVRLKLSPFIGLKCMGGVSISATTCC